MVSRKNRRKKDTLKFHEQGFHGDKYLINLVRFLLNDCSTFIETGTNVGSTLAFVAKNSPHIRCISCEPGEEAYEEALKNTSGLANVEIYNERSQEFIERISLSMPHLFNEEVLFWIDAHGYGFEWPLNEEIAFITRHFKKARILIDDFRVPGLDCFGYDVYKNQVCSFDYIKDSISATSYRLYYPDYTVKTSSFHPLTGWGLIIPGSQPELPEEMKETAALSHMSLLKENKKRKSGRKKKERYYSQNGEDFIIDKLFKDRSHGFFVEIGCIDGRRFSNTLSLEEKGWKGLCVEAHGDYIDLIKKNRPDSIIEHCAIGESNEEGVPFYANSRGTLSSLSREKENHFRENYGKYFTGYEEIPVKKRTISTLLDRHGIKNIDVLSIDIEGYETEGLKGLDLARHRPSLIVVECDSPKQEEDIDRLLLDGGYTKGFRVCENVFYAIDPSFFQNLEGDRFQVRLTHTAHPLDDDGDREDTVHVKLDREDKAKEDISTSLPRKYSFSNNWFEHHKSHWEKRLIPRFRNKGALQILEIGTYEGQSACWFLDHLIEHTDSRLSCIDNWQMKEGKENVWDNMDVVFNRFKKNVALSGKAEQTKIIRGDCAEELKKLDNESYDLIYIDGDHSYEAVIRDSMLAWPLLKKGGMLLWDDYFGSPGDSVKKGIDEFCSKLGLNLEQTGTSVYTVKKKLLKASEEKKIGSISIRSISDIINQTPPEYSAAPGDEAAGKFRSEPDNIFLISFPRTGSHWLRSVMELYFDRPTLTREFYRHENDDYLLLHDHDMDLELERKNVIYLYRDPIDTVFSQINYYKEDEGGEERVRHWTDIYGRHLKKWLYDEGFTTEKEVLRYEDLRGNPLQAIKKISRLYNTPFDASRAKEALSQVTKTTVREKTKWHNPQVLNVSSDYEERRESFRKRHGSLVYSLINNISPAMADLFNGQRDRKESPSRETETRLEGKSKIVGLMAVKNEEILIGQAIQSLSRYTDAIVIYDDGSSDNSVRIAESLKNECNIEAIIKNNEWSYDEHNYRTMLLDEGRRIGGTHFIALDADEMFTSNLARENILKKEILKLKPREQLSLVWIQLWRSTEKYRHDASVWTNNYKTFIFCDDGASSYPDTKFHLARTPDEGWLTKRIEGYEYGVMHFQFVNWRNLLIKQAWYRCLELIRQPDKTASQINALYAPSKDETGLELKLSPYAWFSGYDFLDSSLFDRPEGWRERQVTGWFNEYGEGHFKELDIWDIDWNIKKAPGIISDTSSKTLSRSAIGKTSASVKRDEAFAINMQGENLFIEEDLDGAFYYFQKAIATDPGFAAAHTNMGIVFQSKGDREKALFHYKQAITLEPDNILFKKNLADFFYIVLGDTEKAVPLYLDVVALEPSDDEALKALGQISLTGGMDKEAAIYFSKALEADPTNGELEEIIQRLTNAHASELPRECSTDLSTVEDLEFFLPAAKQKDYLVSAIVSTYNSERFIRGCLESLQAQTIADRLEIIVVDSASMQNEKAIIDEFREKYGNISYIRTKERETVYQAWNRGIRASSGKYITNANTDDRLRCDALELLTNLLEADRHKAVAYGDSIISEVENETFENCTPSGYLRWPDFSRRDLINFCCIGPHPVWRKSLHDKEGYFDERYRCSSDYEFWLRLALKYDFIHTTELLGLYWQNESTVSMNGDLPLSETAEIQKKYRESYTELLNKEAFLPVKPESKKKKGKILYLVHEFPPYTFGGTGAYTYSLCMEMLKKGYETWVAYPVRRDTNQYSLNLKSYNGIGIVEIISPLKRDLLFDLNNDQLNSLFEKHLMSQQYKLIHIQHLLGLSSNMVKTIKELNIPLVQTLHDFWFICHTYHLIQKGSEPCNGPDSAQKCADCFVRSHLQKEPAHISRDDRQKILELVSSRNTLLRETLELPDIILSPSEYLKETFEKYGVERGTIKVNPLGVNMSENSRLEKNQAPDGIIRFAYLGRLSKMKGLFNLIEAFGKSGKKGKLSIYGFGGGKDFAEKLKNIPNISYHGAYTQYDLPKIFSRIDMAIVPSLAESYSFVTREALYAGVPVLASNIGGIPEAVINGRNGLLFDPTSVEDMAQKIEKIIKNPGLIKKLKANIEAPKNIKDEADRIEQLYSEVASKKKKEAKKPNSKTAGENLTSIVILTYNQLKFTKECVESIKAHTPEKHEIIFVDNGSSDGTTKWLRQICKDNKNYKLIANGKNLGFAAGCNQGMKAAKGEYILLLNNDVVVTKNWLEGMLECVKSSDHVGITGPMTNSISGPQKIEDVGYSSIDGLEKFAASFRNEYRYRWIESGRVVGYCMLFRRDLIDKAGLLDENFGSGNFEDDDFCLRASLEGYRNIIAGDVFIHHYGSASFKGNRINYATAMAKNRAIFDKKWSNIDGGTPLGKKLLLHNAIGNSETLSRKGKPADAIRTLVNAIKASPKETRLFYSMAHQLINAKQYKEAMEMLARTEGSGDEAQRFALMGQCTAGMGDMKKAEEYADRALLLNDSLANAHNLKGVIKYESGKKSEAESAFKIAIKCDPSFGEAYRNLAIMKLAEEKREEAIQLFEKAFILSPLSSDIATTYHVAMTESGENERCEKRLRDALHFYPDEKRLSFLLIDTLLKQQKNAVAMDEIERAMINFGIDDGILDAALDVRKKIGVLEISDYKSKETLSLCMIVKNEEKHLAKCLESVKPLASEIIVVDTGSTDRTKDIAIAFGAKVFDFEWTGDFSEARNYSLDQAKGEKVLVMDADEVISPIDYKEIRRIISRRDRKTVAHSIETRNYVSPSNIAGWTANDGLYSKEEAGSGWFGGTKVRLFTNDSRIRFENPVHELVEPSLKRHDIKTKKCAVPVHHYGKLDEEKNTGKGEAYYQLGMKKLNQMQNDTSALRELAIQAGELGRYDDAATLWEKIVHINPDIKDAWLNLGHSYLESGKFSEALTASKKALEKTPDMKEAMLNCAMSELYAGEIERARELTERILEKTPAYPAAELLSATLSICIGKTKEGGERLNNLERLKTDLRPGLDLYLEKLRLAGRNEYAAILEDFLQSITVEARDTKPRHGKENIIATLYH